MKCQLHNFYLSYYDVNKQIRDFTCEQMLNKTKMISIFITQIFNTSAWFF